MKSKKGPTISDVAELAGVSVSTVSHVLNRTRFISPETEKRVLEAIRALGYQKSLIASAMRKQSLQVMGFVVSQLHNIFWLRIIRSLEFHLSQAGYHLFLGCSYGKPEREIELVEMMRQSSVGGVIIATSLHSLADVNMPQVLKEEFVNFLKERAVFVDTAPIDGDFDFVGVDNEKSAYCLTNILLDAGYSALGMINGEPTVLTARERATGFWRALQERNLEVCEEHIFLGSDLGRKTGIEGAQRLLSLPNPPEAIFLASGNITIGFLEIARDRGIRIPEDMSVVAFDDIEWTPVITPFLTCAIQPAWDIGERAVGLLLEKLRKGGERSLQETRLKCKIVVRSSVKLKSSGG